MVPFSKSPVKVFLDFEGTMDSTAVCVSTKDSFELFYYLALSNFPKETVLLTN